jgi:ketosteroid isomerase-like protein
MMSYRAVVLGLVSALAVSACTAPPPAPVDTRAADEAAIRQSDADWARAAQAKQVAPWVAFYSDDAVVMPPNDQPATTKEAIEKSVGELLTAPDLTIGWQPVQVEAARSGDIGYSRGTYEIGFRNEKGRHVTEHGKYLEIWKKQAGVWKCAISMWNSDPPP